MPGARHPLVDWSRPAPARPADGVAAPELADEVFGRSVVVGEVPGREAGIVVIEHGRGAATRVDLAVAAGHLPHADWSGRW